MDKHQRKVENSGPRSSPLCCRNQRHQWHWSGNCARICAIRWTGSGPWCRGLAAAWAKSFLCRDV